MPSAEKQLARIPNPDKGRILAAIAALEEGIEGGISARCQGGRIIGCAWGNGAF